MTVCGAVGALMVGGRVVGQVKCELEAGHHESTRRLVHDYSGGAYLCRRCEASRPAAIHFDCEPWPATPHAMTLTWTPEAEPDLDLFDPSEPFDVDVPFGDPDERPCQVCGVPCDPSCTIADGLGRE